MSTTLIVNIGAIVSGDLSAPFMEADRVLIEDGVFREIGTDATAADVVIDARGLLLVPGLIDGHSHPVFGDFAPPQSSTGWMNAYLHCGVTTLVSAGELHLPGLPIDRMDPVTTKYLAVLARRCYATYRPGGAKVIAGTALLTPGLTQQDFDELAREGCRIVKFIFYPYEADPDEARQYVSWARERGLTVKIHSGGVSRSGLSRPAGAAVINALRPDVVAHATGGPIPMPSAELFELLTSTEAYLEIAYSGNTRTTIELIYRARKLQVLHRLTMGTDTPSGTGTTPRAMLRLIAVISSVGGIPAAQAICIATGNTARAHGLRDLGLIRAGAAADAVLMGPIEGSAGHDALEALEAGDIPGVSVVLVDGVALVHPRSAQTPPPRELARVQVASTNTTRH